MSLPWAEGWGLVHRIEQALLPMCERLVAAGSIRRRRVEVNDIDFVILPKPGMDAPVRERIKQGKEVIRDGTDVMIVKLANGVQVDFFFARAQYKDLLEPRPGNFGSLLLCRTGSKEHNIYLIEVAKAKGMRWQPHEGIYDAKGKLIASETEEEIFQALGLEFVEPENRER